MGTFCPGPYLLLVPLFYEDIHRRKCKSIYHDLGARLSFIYFFGEKRNKTRLLEKEKEQIWASDSRSTCIEGKKFEWDWYVGLVFWGDQHNFSKVF